MTLARPGRRTGLLVLTSTFPRWIGDTCPMFVAHLSEALARSFDVTVLAPASAGARRFERWGTVAVRRFRYCWPERSQRLADGAILPNLRRNRLLLGQVPGFVLAQLWAAWCLARRGAFDAVHAHWALPQGWVAAVLRARLGIPVLTTTHGGDMYALRSGVPLKAKRWALRSSDRVTAVSRSLKREVLSLGVEEERVSVLPMGVDTARFTPEAASPSLRRELNPDGPVVLFVGRLVEKKGARYAIEAMPEILREEPGARLVVVGDGPERETLVELTEQLEIGAHVSFAGAIPNHELPAHFASADVCVGPSVVEANGDTESFGVVFAEAMASGCPVVATDVGGITDLVVDGKTGFLVPQRNAEAISDRVARLLGDSRIRESMRGEGIARMRDTFDHRRMSAAYADIIKEVVAA